MPHAEPIERKAANCGVTTGEEPLAGRQLGRAGGAHESGRRAQARACGEHGPASVHGPEGLRGEERLDESDLRSDGFRRNLPVRAQVTAL